MDYADVTERAIARLGGSVAAAPLVGLKQPSISSWKRRKRIPAEHCQLVSKLTGIPLHELRPDIYPAPEQDGEAA